MPARSKIAKLPDPIRSELDRLLRDGRYTIRDITTHLQTMGADISRGSVQRHSQKMERLAQRAREMREVSAVFARELGEVPDSAATTMLAETLSSFMLRFAADADAEERGIDPKDIMMMARSVKDLAAATRTSTELEIKITDRVKKEAAGRAEKVAKEKGLSAETVNMLKAQILGITPDRLAGTGTT